MKQPEPSEFLLLPFREFDLFVVYRAADISRPFYVNYTQFIKAITASITPASALLLQTNGTNNPTQSLLNLVAGTDISITDDGAGNITFAFTGSGGTYTVDNGLTASTPSNFQLGSPTSGSAPLLHDTYIDTLVDKTLFLEGQKTNQLEYILEVNNTANDGGSLKVSSLGLGIAITATSTSASAVAAVSTNAPAIAGTTGGANEAGLFTNSDAGTNNIVQGIKLRHSSSGVPTTGFGIAADFTGKTTLNSDLRLGRLIFQWTNAVTASRTSKFQLETINSASASVKVEVAGNGETTLNSYGVGTFLDTPVYALGVKAGGEIVEFAVPSGGSVLTDDSIQGDGTLGNEVKLVNDATIPGVNKVYGTDNAGNRGWRNELVTPAGVIPGTVVGTFPAKNNSATHLVVGSADRLYVPSFALGIVDVYEASSGDYLGTVPITNAYSCIYVASRNEVWVSSPSSTMTRLNPSTFAVLGTFTGATNVLSYAEVSSTKIYLATVGNTIVEVNPSTLTVTATITAASLGVTNIRYITYVNNPLSLHHQYLAGVCPTDSEFYAINTTTNGVVIAGTNFGGTLGSPPTGITYNSVEDNYYISLAQNQQVRIFKPTSPTVATFQNRKQAPFCNNLVANV